MKPRRPLPFSKGRPRHLTGAPVLPPGQGADKDAPASDADRARKLLSIPARHEQIRTVPLYDGEVGVRVLDDAATAEAHEAARAWCAEHGFGTEPSPGSMSWIEYTVALAAEFCARAVVDSKTGFPLWDDVDALRADLTREDIEYLDEQRGAHQLDVAPARSQMTAEQMTAVVEEAIADPKGRSAEPWNRWPRSMLLALLRIMVSRLRASIGLTSSPTTAAGSPVAR